ncbi:hypothetical protein NKG94_03125 [Micromonospora sp. M12]
MFVLIGGGFVVGSLGYELGTRCEWARAPFRCWSGRRWLSWAWPSCSRGSSPAT